MEFILNELSLYGQFENQEDFFDTLKHNIHCIKLIKKSGLDIYKTQNFHERNITNSQRLCDISKVSGSDELCRFKKQLDSEIYTLPDWDENIKHKLDKIYLFHENDVTATGVAEAFARDAGLISFKSNEFEDCVLHIQDCIDSVQKELFSIYSPKYLINTQADILKLSRIDMLKIKYDNTRLDFSVIEEEYGPEELEKNEFKVLLKSFDKFVNHESFDSIDIDDGLEFKKYKPKSYHDDWFNSAKYRNKTIMKFRYSDKQRVFGYRKGEVFKVLRIERTHKISDKG